MRGVICVLMRLPLALVGELADRVLGPAEPFEYRYSTTPDDVPRETGAS